MSGLVRAEPRFRARRRATRRRAARPVVILATVVTLAAAGAWAVTASPLLRLDAVTVHGVSVESMSRLSVADVVAAANAPIGRSLLQVAPGQIRTRVAALPAVADVQVRRVWPHRLVIDVVERTPVAETGTAAGVSIVDGNGVAFASVATVPATPHLLDLRLGSPLDVGATPDSPAAVDARAGLAVWHALPTAMQARVTWVDAETADDVSFALRMGHGTVTVVWGSPDDGATKLAVLRTLVRHPAHTYDVSTPAIAVTSG